MKYSYKIGLLVRRLREERGLTQEKLAEAIDKTGRTVSQIEHANVATDIDTLSGLARALGLQTWQLCRLADEADESDTARSDVTSRIAVQLATLDEKKLGLVQRLVNVVADSDLSDR